ncbi:MAG: hypothetical protein IPL39_25500 [Opitutaceae bacterium]|nr:hypothetical protein [Opitutaceae bacterium]
MRPLLLSGLLALALPALALAQGQLAPPDAPAPTMKSLTQIEPRTPLRTGNIGVEQDPNGGVRITSGGSYYLDGNINLGTGSAITVLANNVTIDLNGFTLASYASPANGIGILIGAANVTIRNGHLNGGFEFGIADGLGAANVLIEDVRLSNIGSGGIYFLKTLCVVRRCTVTSSGNFGIAAGAVFDSNAFECASTGIYSAGIAQNCTGAGNTSNGLMAETAVNCIGHSGSGTGLQATRSAAGCSGTTSIGDFGLRVATISSTPVAGTAENCRGSVTGNTATGTGLFASTATNCIGESTAGIGLQTTQTATGCSGTTVTGSFGLNVATLGSTPIAGTAENCRGTVTGSTATGTGLSTGAATNCIGTSDAGLGLLATTASNCIGTSASGIGLQADTASNCTGTSTSGERGLYIIGTASYCRGKRAGGIALSATTAIGCTAEAGDFLVTNRYLMP